ncbi:MAG: hypothetical protein M9913_01960 [Bryobacteraceae bacterium]|nr:hypothetical protein [Solibacteraceae bacterium]MCL4840244.1 hypothetical protein [Bryobacteraceae bacterium]MCO5349668.1 hypothetical protein [Bryobacteraceae bacterium]
MSIPFIPILIAVTAAGLIALLYFRLTVSRHRFEEMPQDWDQIEPSRYAPLTRLLSPEDFAFLRTLPGYDPKLEKTLRRRRVDAFRYYLRALENDFGTLQRAGHLLIATGQGSPMLREQLLLARISFTRALWQVRLELVLFRLTGRAVEPGRLLAALQDACGALHLDPSRTGAA